MSSDSGSSCSTTDSCFMVLMNGCQRYTALSLPCIGVQQHLDRADQLVQVRRVAQL
jgi:hypothetical protein